MLKTLNENEFDEVKDIMLYLQKELPNGISLEVANNSVWVKDEREETYYSKVDRESRKVTFEDFTYTTYVNFVEEYNEWLFSKILEMQQIRSSVINTLKVLYGEILRVVGTDEYEYDNLPVDIQRAIGWKRAKLKELE